MSEESITRYHAAGHAIQSGVAYEMTQGDAAAGTSPKSLRTGVNLSKCDQAALVRLLMAKGVFTLDEYEQELADEAEREVQRYEDRANARMEATGSPSKITFG